MTISAYSSSRKGFGIIEMVISLAIILFLAYMMFNAYFKKPLVDKETQKSLSVQGIDTSSYGTAKKSIEEKLKSIQAQHTKSLESIQ